MIDFLQLNKTHIAQLKKQIEEDVRMESMNPEALDAYLRDKGIDLDLPRRLFESGVEESLEASKDELATTVEPTWISHPEVGADHSIASTGIMQRTPLETIVKVWEWIQNGVKRVSATFLPGSLEITTSFITGTLYDANITPAFNAAGMRNGTFNMDLTINNLRQELKNHNILVAPIEISAEEDIGSSDLYITVYFIDNRPVNTPQLLVNIAEMSAVIAEWDGEWSSNGNNTATIKIAGHGDLMDQLRLRPLTVMCDETLESLTLEFG